MLEFRAIIVPKAKVIATVFNPVNPTNPPMLDNLRAQAGAHGMSLLPVSLQPPEGLERRQAGDGLPTFVSVHPSSSAFARCGHNAAQRFGGDVPGADITEAPGDHLVDEREQLIWSDFSADSGARPAVMLMRTVFSRLVNHLVSNRLTERGTGNDVAAIVDASPDARLAGFLGKRGKRRSIARE
jgi:hypothetical protein